MRVLSAPPAAAALAVMLLLVPAARADVFVLKEGGEIDGYDAGTTVRKEQVIGTEKGPRKVFGSRVVEVRPSADPAADFEKYFAGLGKRDAEGAYRLGLWAKGKESKELEEPARRALERALELKPDHAGAREALGYRKVGGEWLTEEQIERRRKDEEHRAELVALYRERMGQSPEVVFTDHWTYLDFIGDKKAADRAGDLEAAFKEAVRVLGSEPWKERGKVLTFDGQDPYLRWLDVEGSKLLGMNAPLLDFMRKSTGMKWTDPAILCRFNAPGATEMHGANVHASGHLLLGRWSGVNRNLPFWIEEGYGGWTEDQVLHSTTSYCYAVSKGGYGNTFRDTEMWEVDFPDWKALAKEAVRKNGFLPLDQLDGLPRGDYSRREVGQAFSLVAFLLREKGEENFREYVRKVKQGKRSPEAFHEVYGKFIEQMEPEWKQFVSGAW